MFNVARWAARLTMAVGVLYVSTWTVAGADELTLYVAPGGNDAWSGRLAEPKGADGPFLTLQRARDEIRKVKTLSGLPPRGIVVEIRGGVYELAAPLTLGTEDSGTAASKIVYRRYKRENVRLIGGRLVADWKHVTDPKILAKLDASARGKVLQADLRAQGIADLDDVKLSENWGQTEAGLELFFAESPMTLARWPNKGTAKIVKTLGPTPIESHDAKGCKEGIFTYEGDRPRRWLEEPKILVDGCWFWDWADQRLQVASIDPERHQITLTRQPQHAYGFRDGQWFYAYNLLSELDQPGEWYLDRATGILYFWPPKPIGQGHPAVSLLPSIVTMNDVSHLSLLGLCFEICRRTAVVCENISNVQIAGCTVRNAGGDAIMLSGRDSGVIGCDILNAGNGGIMLSGGDRPTLTPGNLFAENNHIHHYGRINRMYKAGILLGGVGNRAVHNLIDHSPHMAINFSGNDHRIEFNEIHHVCLESSDAGAIYAGRNWTMRGNVIRHNYLHDITGYHGRGGNGVYLDDQFSSAEISGNLFCNVSHAATICGGRDNLVANNIFVDCSPALYIDACGVGWAASQQETLKKGLGEVPYRSDCWTKRYPQLKNILKDEPMLPKGNVVARNICTGGRWGDLEEKAKALVAFHDNWIQQDPQFADQKHRNFELKENSPVFKSGFQRIPLEKIGPYEDARRASWPIEGTSEP